MKELNQICTEVSGLKLNRFCICDAGNSLDRLHFSWSCGRHEGTRIYEKESGQQAVSREEGPARSAGTSRPQSVRHLGLPPRKKRKEQL